MNFIHENNIIHRDLKSDNIFISLLDSNKINEIAVGDFDVSVKSVNISDKPKSCIGTPSFIAPEVLTSKDYISYDEKIDVYSFGMILYELMTLKYPYYDIKNSFLISNSVINNKHPSISENILHKYPDIVNLHKLCIEYNSYDRPSFNQILTHLQKLRAESTKS
jgi:serine/threonine protein kinase